MQDGFLFSYSDIVFAPEHAGRVWPGAGPVALVVDRRWRDAYEGRTPAPGQRGRAGAGRGRGAAARS